MAQRLIDLDKAGVLSESIAVRLRGTDYELPGDIPAPLFVRVQQVASSGEPDEEIALALANELLSLFQTYQPKMERLPLGLNEMVSVIGYVYSQTDETESETGEGVADEDEVAIDPFPKKSAPQKRKSAS